MNCENFNDRLPEYLDETLSAAEQAAAREHLRECGACRAALAREEASAKSIRHSFERETQGLTLSHEARRNILNALNQSEVELSARESIHAVFAFLWRRPVWAGATLFAFLLLISGGYFLQHQPGHLAPRTIPQEARNTYVIDVPVQTDIHVFRRQNNMVVDAVVTGVTVADAGYSETAGQHIR